LFDAVKAASRVSDSVIVAFSAGKDSCVTLDLCHKYFKRVEAYFMYQIPDLSFQEAAIRFAEQKYGIEILRMPHFEVADFLKYGSFTKADSRVRIVKPIETYNYVREQTGIHWIAAGERIADSIIRRAMIKKSSAIDKDRGRFYPVAEWSKADIVKYVGHHKLKVSPEAALLGHSFRSLAPEDMAIIKKHYPSDFEKIKGMYPFVEASALKMEFNHGSV
jgi:phosphoadenosine phosphosulfate reductase